LYAHGKLIKIESNGMAASDVGELVDELAPHFFEVRLSVRPSPPAASPLGFEFATLLLAVAIISQGFFSELGKDLYRELRHLVIEVGRKARHFSEARGGYTLAVRIERPESYVLFAFVEIPTEDELGHALGHIQQLVATTAEDQFVCFEYDLNAHHWKAPRMLEDYEDQPVRQLYILNTTPAERDPTGR
jgi:hypothetical protein